jgi:hypothetical protein
MTGGGYPLEHPMGQTTRGMEVYNELDDDENQSISVFRSIMNGCMYTNLAWYPFYNFPYWN